MSKMLLGLAGCLLVVSLQPDRPAATAADTSYISTIAGSSIDGMSGDGGPATAARLHWPNDVASDSAGNIYIADTGNNRIRKVSTTGIITTVAGSSDPCTADLGDAGPATTACLKYPHAVTLDGEGNLYIADYSNGRIRKVAASTGIITTIAGNGVPGFSGDGGPATAARINGPRRMAVDSAGNLFIADTNNGRVRMVSPDGLITTVAGNGNPNYTLVSGDGGPATQAQIFPWGVALDGADDLYIVDRDHYRVRKVLRSTGIITTVAGNGVGAGTLGDDWPATQAELEWPADVAVDRAGNLYIADSYRLRKVTASTGIITTIAGNGSPFPSGDGGPASRAQLARSYAVEVDDAGDLYIVDSDFARIRKVTYWHDEDVPFGGDVDGDGRADLVLWRPGTGTWHWLTSSSGYSVAAAGGKQWGSRAAGDVPLLADMDGDGKADLVLWRAPTGTWNWLTSSSGYSEAAARAKQFGIQALGDTPLPGDIDGDGKADLVVWRASTGTWYWLLSSTGFNDAAVESKQWGRNQGLGDVPLRADIDGDGRMDLTVWRQETGWWWARTGIWFWLPSSTGYDYSTASLRQWGSSTWGDTPLPADVDGDGRSDLIVWRSMTGAWYWLTSMTEYSYPAANQRQWGSGSSAVGDKPIVGDFDGDGRTELVVWRASTGTWNWVTSSSGYSDGSATSIQWGSTRP